VAAQARLKVASFTVHATAEQSARWKQAAEAEGHRSVGTWLEGAADAYLKVRARAGMPVPLSWRKGRLLVELQDRTAELPGFLSMPFGAFRGTAAGRGVQACHRYTLVYIPAGRILATVRTYVQCKALASELARTWVRWGGNEPTEDSAPLLQRFQREEA
jgi:hypothetical protein